MDTKTFAVAMIGAIVAIATVRLVVPAPIAPPTEAECYRADMDIKAARACLSLEECATQHMTELSRIQLEDDIATLERCEREEEQAPWAG